MHAGRQAGMLDEYLYEAESVEEEEEEGTPASKNNTAHPSKSADAHTT